MDRAILHYQRLSCLAHASLTRERCRNRSWPMAKPSSHTPKVRHIVRLNRSTSLRLAPVITLMVAVLAGCVPPTPPAPPSSLQKVIVAQHETPLSIGPSHSASATASCASGEVLLSGGYSTDDMLDYENDPQVLGNYPSDASGAPPTVENQIENSWTVSIYNSSSIGLSYEVVAYCLF